MKTPLALLIRSLNASISLAVWKPSSVILALSTSCFASVASSAQAALPPARTNRPEKRNATPKAQLFDDFFISLPSLPFIED